MNTFNPKTRPTGFFNFCFKFSQMVTTFFFFLNNPSFTFNLSSLAFAWLFYFIFFYCYWVWYTSVVRLEIEKKFSAQTYGKTLLQSAKDSYNLALISRTSALTELDWSCFHHSLNERKTNVCLTSFHQSGWNSRSKRRRLKRLSWAVRNIQPSPQILTPSVTGC